jgi:hypothetical protein
METYIVVGTAIVVAAFIISLVRDVGPCDHGLAPSLIDGQLLHTSVVHVLTPNGHHWTCVECHKKWNYSPNDNDII